MLIRTSGEHDWRKAFQRDFRVLLDGREIPDVIEADDVAGFVIHYRRDASGNMVANQDRYETERLTGVVVFAGTKRLTGGEAKAAARMENVRHAAARSEGGAA